MVTSTAPRARDATGELSVRKLLDDARAIEAANPLQARTLVQQARVLARARNDAPGEAEALYRLASVSYSLGNPDDALQVALEASDLARSCGDIRIEVYAGQLIGLVHYRAGNFKDALDRVLNALELYRRSDLHGDEGNLLNTIAAIHHSLGDTERAIVTYEAAVNANKGHNRPENDALVLGNIARIRAERNEGLLAISLGEEALKLAREHAPMFLPELLADLATSYSLLHSLDKARECLDEADQVIRERQASGAEVSAFSMAEVRIASGKVNLATGQHQAAVDDFLAALGIAQEAGIPLVIEKVHRLLTDAYKAQGEFEKALTHSEALFALHQELFDQGTDLRIKTLQIAHDTEHARQQAEILRLRTTELEAMVERRTHDLEEFQLEAFQRLAVLAEFRDTDTGEHTIRVGDLAAEIAAQLGEPADWVDQLRLAGRLHDIGKVSVPDKILLKPGPLTSEEFEVMKTHTTVGFEILSGSTSPLIQLAAVVALNHHERWDGNGYPNGLAAEDIPLSGRIVTVADVYDALISARTYKKAWASIDAIRYIVGARGTQFEPRIVDAFITVMERRDPSVRDRLHP